MISIVCVYNDMQILRSYLLTSLARQTVPYDLHLIDNTRNQTKSIASLFNREDLSLCKEYLMFVHQDVALSNNSFLVDAEKMLDSLSNIGIAGIAGRTNHRELITNITDGEPPKPAGGKDRIQISEPTAVQTVDECCFFIPRTTFQTFRFDDEICNDLHLYSVEYSLNALTKGFKVYVLPLSAHHRSSGASMSRAYFSTLRKVVRKHRRRYKRIYTSINDWNTMVPIIVYQMLSEVTRFRKRRSLRIV